MATKTRLNISLSSELRQALIKLAQRDQIPQATKAVRLLEFAMELEEDQIWNKIALNRDSKAARFIPHDKAWK